MTMVATKLEGLVVSPFDVGAAAIPATAPAARPAPPARRAKSASRPPPASPRTRRGRSSASSSRMRSRSVSRRRSPRQISPRVRRISSSPSRAPQPCGQNAQPDQRDPLQPWRASQAPLELPGGHLGGRLGASGPSSNTEYSQGHRSPQGANFYEVDSDNHDSVRLQHLQTQEVYRDELRPSGRYQSPVPWLGVDGRHRRQAQAGEAGAAAPTVAAGGAQGALGTKAGRGESEGAGDAQAGSAAGSASSLEAFGERILFGGAFDRGDDFSSLGASLAARWPSSATASDACVGDGEL